MRLGLIAMAWRFSALRLRFYEPACDRDDDKLVGLATVVETFGEGFQRLIVACCGECGLE